MDFRFRKWPAEPVYYLLSGGVTLAQASMYTILAVYYVTRVGMNPLQLVLVGTLLETTVLLCEVPTGIVADTFSRRLSVVIGMFVLGAAWLLEGSLPLFAMILLAEVIRGVGETFLSGATDAWLAGEVGEEQVGRIYLRSGQINRLVGLAGIAASVALASIQLNLPVLAGGGLYLALGICLALVMPERGFARPAADGQRPGLDAITSAERTAWQTMSHTFRQGALVVRRSSILLSLFAVSAIAGAASEGFDRLWEAHLLANFTFPSLGALKPVVWFGVIEAGSNLFSLATTELFRRRLEVTSRQPAATARVLLVLEVLSAASVIAFGLAGNFPLALAALGIKAALAALSDPLYNAWLIQNTDPQVRATVLSMLSQSNALGQIAGGPGVGLIGTLVSLRAALVTAGALLSPTILVYARVLRGYPKPTEKTAFREAPAGIAPSDEE
jgi:DHA3 family tetracycline resistance protein-like MFS transporter